MSSLERLCNATLYAPLQTRIDNTRASMAVLIALQIATGIIAAVPLCLYFRLARGGCPPKLWHRFVPFYACLVTGAIAGVVSWASYMEYLASFQILTFDGNSPEYQGQPLSRWFSLSFKWLCAFLFFYPIEFSCFLASKMFVLERLVTFGSMSMGEVATSRARRIFMGLLAALCSMCLVFIAAGWASAAFGAPLAQNTRLNQYSSDYDSAAYSVALKPLFEAISTLFIVNSLALVTAAFGCVLFCFYCIRRMQQVSLALHNAPSTSKYQAAETSLLKTRRLIVGTSVVITLSFVLRAALYVLLGITFSAKYNAECLSQCKQVMRELSKPLLLLLILLLLLFILLNIVIVSIGAHFPWI